MNQVANSDGDAELARLRSVFDSAVDSAIIATDLDGLVTDWNAGAQSILGWTSEEMVGQRLDRLFTEDDLTIDRPGAERREARETGRTHNEGWRVRKSGERFWAAGEMAPLVGAGGAVVGFVKLLRDRTEEHRSAQALAEAEARLQSAQEAGGVGLFSIGVADDLIQATPQFCRLFGLPERSVYPAAEVERLVIREDADQMSAPETRSAGSAPVDVVYRIRRADNGALRWLSRKGEFKRDAAGVVTRFVGAVRDITDQRQLEARQATLLELADAVRDLDDANDIVLAASEVLARSLQVSRVGYGVIDKVEETITIERDWNAPGAQSLAGVLNFRDYGSYIDNLKRGETVAISDAREDPRTRDGAAALAAISATSFVNMPLVEQGQFVALLYANHAEARSWTEADLGLMREAGERIRAATERARAKQALSESEEQFRAFAQAVPNHIWAARPDGWLYWFNQQAYTYSGRTPGELDGYQAWGEVVHPEDLEEAGAAWRAALSSGEVYKTEFRIRNAEGGYRWFLVQAEPVRAQDGTILRWVGTNTDIDDQRRHTEAFERLNASLEDEVQARTAALMAAEEALRQSQKMEAVGQLTGGLAHDFNNLLTGITGSLELLSNRIAQGRYGEVERYVAAAQGAAKRAAALTHRLLAFSRRQTLDPRPTNVNRLVGGMEDLVRRTVGPAIDVEVVTLGGLWPTLVDGNQLENALLNLCINARDAMPGGGRLTIETGNRWLDHRGARERGLEPGQYVALCVSDTGTGMTPEVISKAFDPFFTTKPLGLGTGLGLSMIYGFTQQSGGQVKIYSEMGEGTMVCIYLPRFRGEADEVEVESEMSDAVRARDGETVLVVDDEPTVRMLVTEVLEELGYAAIEAADGPAGLRILQSDQRIDLVVTDVGLPSGMNGRQMADAARVARPDLKVLFITGYAENAVVGAGHLEPGMHVMTKPFAMDALAARIRDLIERS